MLILELSRRTGISRHTIRYYEKYGLIRADQRRENSYKEYGEQAMYSLIFIDQVKKLGFSLYEIREFLELLGRSRKEASEAMERKMALKSEQLDAKIRSLQAIRENVNALLNHCRSNPHKGTEGIKELVQSMEGKTANIGMNNTRESTDSKIGTSRAHSKRIARNQTKGFKAGSTI